MDELSKRGVQSLFELCTRQMMAHGIGSSRQAISQHLAVLEDVGLVVPQRRGRSKLHWFEAAPLKAIVERSPIPESTKHGKS